MFIYHFIELYFQTSWWNGMPSYTHNTKYGIFFKDNGFLFFTCNQNTVGTKTRYFKKKL